MNTTVELSPGKAQISTEHFNFSREETPKNPLTPLTQGEFVSNLQKKRLILSILGTLTNLFSAVVAISKESKATIDTFAVKQRKKLPPLQERDSLSEQTR
jgi:hypothetical protein